MNGDDWICPPALRDTARIVMGHGGGGRQSSDLIEHLFLPAFRNPTLDRLGDAAILPAQGRMALTTDSFVVRPLFFPGGCIGDLAVHGTINDLAVSGATPHYLSVGFILEEGMPLKQLAAIVNRMGEAARASGVSIVTGDTKVVEKGHGDGCFITTTGVGFVAEGVALGAERVCVGDGILLSGPIGNHGMAIMSAREGLAFETTLKSDTAALHPLTLAMLDACPDIRVMRDPTRGGLAASLNEIAAQSAKGIEIIETLIPVEEPVRAACELLGLDPFLVANEGKLVAIVPEADCPRVLKVMRAHPLGKDAVWIGKVTDNHPGLVTARTAVGARRVVAMPYGEQLPRIC